MGMSNKLLVKMSLSINELSVLDTLLKTEANLGMLAIVTGSTSYIAKMSPQAKVDTAFRVFNSTKILQDSILRLMNVVLKKEKEEGLQPSDDNLSEMQISVPELALYSRMFKNQEVLNAIPTKALQEKVATHAPTLISKIDAAIASITDENVKKVLIQLQNIPQRLYKESTALDDSMPVPTEEALTSDIMKILADPPKKEAPKAQTANWDAPKPNPELSKPEKKEEGATVVNIFQSKARA